MASPLNLPNDIPPPDYYAERDDGVRQQMDRLQVQINYCVAQDKLTQQLVATISDLNNNQQQQIDCLTKRVNQQNEQIAQLADEVSSLRDAALVALKGQKDILEAQVTAGAVKANPSTPASSTSSPALPQLLAVFYVLLLLAALHWLYPPPR
jgi:cell division septum initiation protein DivIVA